jgi:hypothetical protein
MLTVGKWELQGRESRVWVVISVSARSVRRMFGVVRAAGVAASFLAGAGEDLVFCAPAEGKLSRVNARACSEGRSRLTFPDL